MYKILGADQKEYGPVSAETIRQWITEGRVNANTKVQAEGSVEWKLLSQTTEFGLVVPAPMPPPIAPVAPAPATNTTAIWAFGVSIFSLFCCQFLGGITALVLGIIASSQLKKNPHQQGKGFATAAVIIGAVSLLLGLILGVIYFSFISEAIQHGFPR